MRRRLATIGAIVFLASLAAAPPTLAGGRAKSGWGADSSFVGRYRVKVTQPGSAGVRGGELTMFIQEEFPGSAEPAGILKLRTKTNNDVVYLKELKRRGRMRTAIVKGGSYLGPTIGNFKATMKRPGLLVGRVATKGLGTVRAVFHRYSTKPTP
ncbi:MAG TPA: hypothetical protein VMF55_05710 [Solirubrobacterales bacterium]|nr:hypothetical protein [Solirubrobacterales bacterium]